MDWKLEFISYAERRAKELDKSSMPPEEVLARAKELLLSVDFLDSKEKMEQAMEKMRTPA